MTEVKARERARASGRGDRISAGRDIRDQRLIKALAHPLRVRILSMLETREMASPNELADELASSLGVMSYHVRRLHALGFVELVKRVPRRGAIEHYYRGKTGTRRTDTMCAAAPLVVEPAPVGVALQRIGGYVSAAGARGGFDRPDAHLVSSALTLDGEGWRRLADEMQAWVAGIEQVEEKVATRIQEAGGGAEQHARTCAVVLMLFDATGAPDPTADAGDP